MKKLIFHMAILAWYVSGVASFLYWESMDNDVRLEAVFFSLLLGVGGPTVYVEGCVMDHHYGDVILIHHRRHEKDIWKEMIENSKGTK
jgi:hypothetical protein